MISKQVDEIHVKDSENVIRFKKGNKPRDCKHSNIKLSVEDSEILCTDCNTRLNPVWWIKYKLEQLNSSARRNNAVLAEARAIWDKLEKTNTYMCKHCHEPNTIDFRRLPSKAAVTRKMSVIEEEFDGFKVEID